MAQNIEIKARYGNDKAMKIIHQNGFKYYEMMNQKDVFYNVPNARLKLRQTGKRSELIYYQRQDYIGPKPSFYEIMPIEYPERLNTLLSLALTQLKKVEKIRVVYLDGQTRIHVDNVNNLGEFIEFEVVLRDGQSHEDGVEIAQRLMELFDIQDSDLIECAYMDLLS